MTESDRVRKMYADAATAEGRRTQHDPGGGLRSHVVRAGVPDRPAEEPLRRAESAADAQGSSEHTESENASDAPDADESRLFLDETRAMLEQAKLCVCGEPRSEHTQSTHDFEPMVPRAIATITDVLSDIEKLRRAIEQLRAHRAEAEHRRGTGPAYRQEGELNVLDMVLTYIEHGTFTPGENSITCPHCQRISHHPDDVANRYCDACGYHDQPTKRGDHS